jgi:hypothetical protein
MLETYICGHELCPRHNIKQRKKTGEESKPKVIYQVTKTGFNITKK